MVLSKTHAILGAFLLAMLALISPVTVFLATSGGEVFYTIYTLFWSTSGSFSAMREWMPNVFWVIVGYIPFVALRLVVPLQFDRYYAGRTSRQMVLLAGLIGEIPPLLLIFGSAPSMYLTQLVFSLPLHMLICVIVILWKPVKYDLEPFPSNDR